jgi:ketosteroid isomerase-like protein
MMASERCWTTMGSFLEAMGASKGDEMAPYLAEDVRWWFPPSAAEAVMVPRFVDGREGVLAILGHADSFFKQLVYTLVHVVEDGDMVAVHAGAHGETMAGRSYENEYQFLLRIRDGRIVEGWEFVDTAYAYSRNE